MEIKKGARVKGLQPEMLLALVIADQIYRQVSGRGVVVTEITGSVHKPNSLHYSGQAADLRTRDLTADQQTEIFKTLAVALGSEFDVVPESDHLHVEFDPV